MFKRVRGAREARSLNFETVADSSDSGSEFA
jgi:hypothetical protein